MRFLELFQDDKGILSMTRLLMFFSFFVGSYMVITLDSETALEAYLAAYGVGYLGSKFLDRKKDGKDDTQ